MDKRVRLGYGRIFSIYWNPRFKQYTNLVVIVKLTKMFTLTFYVLLFYHKYIIPFCHISANSGFS